MRLTKTAALPVRALAVTALLLPLAACNNEGGSITPPPAAQGGGDTPIIETQPAQPGDVELTFRWWGGSDRQERTLNAIRVCEEENPGIHINPLPVSFDGFYDQIMVEFAAQNPPDIFQMDVGRPREFGSNGLLLPLDGLVDLDVSPSILEESSYDGQIFGAAATANAPSMLVNPRLFQEAGVTLPPEGHIWTWAEFNDLTHQLAANLPAGDYAVEFAPVNLLPAWITQRNGIGPYTADGEVIVPPEQLAQFLDFYQGLVNDGVAPPAAQVGETWTVGPEETLMGRGHAAITFVPSSSVTAFSSASGDDLLLERIPGDDSEAHIGTLVNIGIYWGISAFTEHPVEAGIFVNCMINSEAAGEYLGVERGVPLNTRVAAAIAPGLNEVSQQQVEYMANVINSGAGTNRGVPGAGQAPEFTNRAVQTVLFDQADSVTAAQTWISDMQDSINNARVN